MKKTLILCVTLLLTTSAYAVDYFFEKTIGYWSVVGHPGDSSSNLNPACVSATRWDDGSYINIIQDLKDGELWMEFKNNEWNVEGPYGQDAGQQQLTLNMFKGRSVSSWNVNFLLVNKNTIHIHGLTSKFIEAFAEYDMMRIIPPGTILNAEVRLQNSRAATTLMGECIKAYKPDNVGSKDSIQNL